jgi:hypothetical protein
VCALFKPRRLLRARTNSKAHEQHERCQRDQFKQDPYSTHLSFYMSAPADGKRAGVNPLTNPVCVGHAETGGGDAEASRTSSDLAPKRRPTPRDWPRSGVQWAYSDQEGPGLWGGAAVGRVAVWGRLGLNWGTDATSGS